MLWASHHVARHSEKAWIRPRMSVTDRGIVSTPLARAGEYERCLIRPVSRM